MDCTDGLPFAWKSTKLSEIAEINPGLPDRNLPDNMEVSFLPMKAVEQISGRIDLTLTVNFAKVKKGYTPITNGDIIFAKITPCMENGKIAIVDNLKNGIGFASTEFHVIRLRDEAIPRKFIFYCLIQQDFRNEARRNMTGTAGQLRVPAKYMKDVSIPFPPISEQRRIVAKIEALFAESKTAREALDKVPVLLRRFRQSVLTKAFRGELTKRDSNDESVQKLLGKIKKEREKGKQLSLTESEGIFSDLEELPETWAWTTIGDLFEITSGGTPRRNRPEYWRDGDIAWVSSGEVAFSDITQTREHITKEGLENSSAKLCSPGTVLLALYGEGKTRGQVAILRILAATNQAIACISCSETSMPSEYLYWWLYHRYFETRRIGEGANQPNIYLHHVRAMPFPLAPISEQRRVVARIRELFSIADDVETNVEKAKRRTDSVDQAVLVKAFRGELVPQYPNDEPASMLLERISAASKLDKSLQKRL